MKRFAASLTIVVLFCATQTSDAFEGTRVTSGAMTFETTVGQIDVRGQSGFRMRAGVDVVSGVYMPWNQCSVPECPPGTVVSLYAFWSGGDLRGTVRLDGIRYILGSEGEGTASGLVEFDGHVVVPAFTDSGTAEVSAPFTMTGQIWPYSADGSAPSEVIGGSGVATLQLSLNFDGSSWHIDGALYEFVKERKPKPARTNLSRR